MTKPPFDWTQRIESDAEWIRTIVEDEHKYRAGFHSNADFAKIRGILQTLVSDVEITTRQQMENKVISPAQREVK